MKALIFLFCLAPLQMQANSVRALYNSLDPTSVAEALAFFELYPDSVEGKQALEKATALLQAPSTDIAICLPHLINRLKGSSQELSEQELVIIETLAAHLPNRHLKGYAASSEEELLLLPSDEIDLGKALVLSQLGNVADASYQARCYSAMLDLMALQILAKLSNHATFVEKIHATNIFIFDQMHFRFPPKSVYAENIDLYTFLPSVMDNHLGVCLGVTAMYLAIAQRIGLPLEIITPPGHIYVRYRDPHQTVNIETTARGVHMPDETYLSVQNPKLEQRTLKEVIGMTHVNLASTYLYRGEYQKAVAAYEKALPYMPDDLLVKELLGYSCLFTEKKAQGEALLKEVGKGMHGIAEDYLNSKVDLDGIQAVFIQVDDTRESLLSKLGRLEKITQQFPEFRDGLHQLAVTWIQLGRAREAMDALSRYFTLDPEDAVTAYYLSVLHGQRHDFKTCWHYLKKAEALTAKENFSPKALRELRRTLIRHCPEDVSQ